MEINNNTVPSGDSVLAVSTIPLNDGRALWMGQDMRIKILDSVEWEQWRQYVSLMDNPQTPDSSGLREKGDGLFPLRSLAQFQQAAMERVSSWSRLEFNSHPLTIDYLTILSDPQANAETVTQDNIRQLVKKIIMLCSYNVAITISHDCHHPLSKIVLEELWPYIGDRSIRPDIICRCSCDDCCNKLLASRERTRLTILYSAARGVNCNVSEEETANVRLCLYLDEEDIPTTEMPSLLLNLAKEHPNYPIKVRVRKLDRPLDRTLLDAVRKTPSASFFGCRVQNLFRSLSVPSPNSRPCFMVGSVKTAVDLHGNMYSCDDMVDVGAVGNILREDGQELLESILSSRRRRFSSCLATCPLAFACCGCLSTDCSMAKDLFAVSVESVYECLRNPPSSRG